MMREGFISKGNQNPPDLTAKRPAPPRGSGSKAQSERPKLSTRINGIAYMLQEADAGSAKHRDLTHDLAIAMTELATKVEQIERTAASAANVAGCLANGITPD